MDFSRRVDELQQRVAATKSAVQVRSWERSLLTLVTLVGVWAIVYGVNEIFAAFTLRKAGKQAKRLPN